MQRSRVGTGPGQVNDGGFRASRLAVAGETEVIVRAGAVGEVLLAEGVEAAQFV